MRFRNYEHNWDGQGAEAPAIELLESAEHLGAMLRDDQIAPPCCVVVGVNGTVIFEWQWEDGAYLEIEVIEPDHADACLIVPGQPTEYWTLE